MNLDRRIKKIAKNCGHELALVTYGGSLAYGTNVKGSDVDIRGICLHNPNELLGYTKFEQYEDKKDDTVIYGINKIVNLLINCNPNVIEILGTKDEHVFLLSEEGKMLRDNSDLFISQRCMYSFGGYAISQLRRLENGLIRKEPDQNKKEEHILGSIESSFYHLETHYHPFVSKTQTLIDKLLRREPKGFDLYIGKSIKEDMDTEILVNVNLKDYPLRDFVNIFSEMQQTLKSYSKIGKRNTKKTEESLYKHAMHLIRLYLMCIDLLEGKGICTYRNDREFLLDIRNEKYTFEQLMDMANDYEKKMQYAAKHTNLPKKVNTNKIEELVIEINKKSLKK